MFRPFQDARAYARTLNLRTSDEWFSFSKSNGLPIDIPAAPHMTYRDHGWNGYGDWLRAGAVPRGHKSFEEGRRFARNLKLSTYKDWRRFAKTEGLPAGIPLDPARTYRGNGWMGWGDWLGTGRVANSSKLFRSFVEARRFAQSLNLTSVKEWQAYARSGKRPRDIPAAPARTYKNQGWNGMGDWLGTHRVATKLRSYQRFEDAKAIVHRLNIASETEWRQIVRTGKLPPDLPAKPDRVYLKHGWAGWGDWLGTGRKRRSNMTSFRADRAPESIDQKSCVEDIKPERR